MRLKCVLVVVSSLLISSCRETLPPDVGGSPPFVFRFTSGSYYAFDNWQLDYYGYTIPGSYFRNSWTVADTGRSLLGWTQVTVVIDSMFDSSGSFVHTDSLFFRMNGSDVYQWGFVKSLIADRETLQLAPAWDRIAAFSVPPGNAWTIARIDTSVGAPGPESITGSITPAQEYTDPIAVNGEERRLFSYRVDITKPGLYYTFWMTSSPASFAKLLDESDVLRNATLRTLKWMTVR